MDRILKIATNDWTKEEKDFMKTINESQIKLLLEGLEQN